METFTIIKPNEEQVKNIVVFPHSGNRFFIDDAHKKLFNKSINQNSTADSYLYTLIQENDNGLELVINDILQEEHTYPDTLFLINHINRSTGGDLNRTVKDKQVPDVLFNGENMYDPELVPAIREYTWMKHIEPFQKALIKLAGENPEAVITHVHSMDPLPGHSSYAKLIDEARPVGQIMTTQYIPTKVHKDLWPEEVENIENFEVQLIKPELIQSSLNLLTVRMCKYYSGSNQEGFLPDRPYDGYGEDTGTLVSIVALADKINSNEKRPGQLMVEANKLALHEDAKAQYEYLDGVDEIARRMLGR